MIIAGYIVYLFKYRISEEFYSGILSDLEERERAAKPAEAAEAASAEEIPAES